MAYVKIAKNGKRKLLESTPKYYFDGGIPVSNTWLIEHENIYPVIEQDLSTEKDVTDIIDIIVKPIDDWVVNKTNIIKTVWIVIDELTNSELYDKSYQVLKLNDKSEWIKSDKYIFRTYSVITKSINSTKNDLKTKLKEKRKKIETGGLRYHIEQGKYYKIQTDIKSQLQLSKYFMALDLFESINWKSFDEFIKLSSKNIKELFLIIQTFIKICFDNEKRIIELIEKSNTYDELKNIYDNEFNIGWDKQSIYLIKENI